MKKLDLIYSDTFTLTPTIKKVHTCDDKGSNFYDDTFYPILAGPRGGGTTGESKSFLFMQLSAKCLQNNRLAHPLWELEPSPPQENPGSATDIHNKNVQNPDDTFFHLPPQSRTQGGTFWIWRVTCFGDIISRCFSNTEKWPHALDR